MKSAMPPRLLIVGAFPKESSAVFGGMLTSCRALLQSSLPQRVSLDVLDSTQISVPLPSFPVRLGYAIVRVVRYVHRLEHRRPDAVLLFAAVGASLAEKGAMAWYARLRGVRCLMFPRGGGIIDSSAQSRLTRWWVRLALRGANVVLCQSARWRDFAEGLGFPVDRALVVPNWTATPGLIAIGRARRQSAEAAAKLLFIGWLDREKGVAELLQACQRLQRSDSFTLDIVGEGNFSEQARTYVAQHGMSSIVRFRGALNEDALRSVLSECNILALPSWAEGLPNAMVEAMAAGLAVVVTAVGSIPDVVTNEQDALVVPPRDIAALENALRRVIGDPALRTSLGAAACARAQAQFAVEPAVEKILEALARAMGNA